MREEYFSPVGFAKERGEERRRWFGRLVMLAFMGFLVWLFLTHVVAPPNDTPTVPTQQASTLPGE
ncbi:MAG: hypothetical protein ABR548_13625 [Actinomycetota bacterium]|nr:otopetrin domain-containing protein [Actinomycetota bacterium]